MKLTKQQKQLIDKGFWIGLIISNSPAEAAQVMLNMGETMSDTPDLEELGAVADRLVAAGRKEQLFNQLALLFPDWEDIPHDVRVVIDAHLYQAQQKNFVGPPMEDGSYVSNGNGNTGNNTNWQGIIATIGQVIGPLLGQSGIGGQQQQAPPPPIDEPKWYDSTINVVFAVVGGLAFIGISIYGISKLSD